MIYIMKVQIILKISRILIKENKFLKAKNYLNMKQVKIFYITMTLFLFTILKELLFPLLYQITKK